MNIEIGKPPTNRALSRWWQETMPHVPSILTCACGKSGPSAYIQPQHPYFAARRPGGDRMTVDANGLAYIDGRIVATCAGCIDAANRQARAKRRETLAAMARCEVAPCKRRGAYRAKGVLLCGAHLKNVQREHARIMSGAGALALFLPAPDYTREDLIRMAGGAA